MSIIELVCVMELHSITREAVMSNYIQTVLSKTRGRISMTEQPHAVARHGGEDDKNTGLFGEIDNLVDQTLQIYELTSKESTIIKSIDSSIAMLLTTLRTSLPLSPDIFHEELPTIKSAVLNNNGEIIIMQADGNIVTKKFSELVAGQVMEVVREIVPKLRQESEVMKVAATEEIALLRKVAKQFQRVKVQVPADRSKIEAE